MNELLLEKQRDLLISLQQSQQNCVDKLRSLLKHYEYLIYELEANDLNENYVELLMNDYLELGKTRLNSISDEIETQNIRRTQRITAQLDEIINALKQQQNK